LVEIRQRIGTVRAETLPGHKERQRMGKEIRQTMDKVGTGKGKGKARWGHMMS
jgi:hypothetical protein